MDNKIHRFKVGYDGEMLEIVNPTELSLDQSGGLLKVSWVDEKGRKQRIVWNEKTQKYDSYENGFLKNFPISTKGRKSRQ